MGIRIYKPESGDVLDFADEANKHNLVVSIDTALAHLCATVGIRVELLLPKYCDERWSQLLNNESCYQYYCTARKQTDYGNWESVINKLCTDIIQKSN